ncbi:hypothetical protein Bhyg_01467 [Pseudolycoriella hygida]|uniref:Uncharacterized protein n=1 Tax=Pseudolycoriella hygida TaxID=35572 RepID=A0A9Q0N9F3_9DIPT|nr:hypothetical protein Bhyg_01467 [Pseudolycoriella hygida]
MYLIKNKKSSGSILLISFLQKLSNISYKHFTFLCSKHVCNTSKLKVPEKLMPLWIDINLTMYIQGSPFDEFTADMLFACKEMFTNYARKGVGREKKRACQRRFRSTYLIQGKEISETISVNRTMGLRSHKSVRRSVGELNDVFCGMDPMLPQAICGPQGFWSKMIEQRDKMCLSTVYAYTTIMTSIPTTNMNVMTKSHDKDAITTRFSVLPRGDSIIFLKHNLYLSPVVLYAVMSNYYCHSHDTMCQAENRRAIENMFSEFRAEVIRREVYKENTSKHIW